MQIGAEKEEYFWLVWITVGPDTPQRLLLTNNNLIRSKSPDSVFEAEKGFPSWLQLTLNPELCHRKRPLILLALLGLIATLSIQGIRRVSAITPTPRLRVWSQQDL